MSTEVITRCDRCSNVIDRKYNTSHCVPMHLEGECMNGPDVCRLNFDFCEKCATEILMIVRGK
jgi:hypothetical protein